MLITSIDTTEIVNLISKHISSNPALLSVGEHTDVDLNLLIESLNQNSIEFIGGIFPKVIHGNSILDKGIVVNTLNNTDSIGVIENLSTKNYNIPNFDFDTNKDYSLFTYVDGLTSNISNYLSELYEKYGMETNYFGGGAGSLSLKQKPCVFSNKGIFEDAAVFAIMSMSSKIGVSHGWEKVDGPFIITKAEGNIIKEINWKNPFEVYKEVVEKHSGKKFTDDNFFEIAKGYPFGILKKDAECIVRDPFMVNENDEMICVGEVENNMVVDILHGNEKSLINAAKQATLNSAKQANTPHKAILIDCISRILFLEENFNKELNVITNTLQSKFPNVSIGGALTLGEISSYGEGYLEFYNKTTVVGLFE